MNRTGKILILPATGLHLFHDIGHLHGGTHKLKIGFLQIFTPEGIYRIVIYGNLTPSPTTETRNLLIIPL